MALPSSTWEEQSAPRAATAGPAASARVIDSPRRAHEEAWSAPSQPPAAAACKGHTASHGRGAAVGGSGHRGKEAANTGGRGRSRRKRRRDAEPQPTRAAPAPHLRSAPPAAPAVPAPCAPIGCALALPRAPIGRAAARPGAACFYWSSRRSPPRAGSRPLARTTLLRRSEGGADRMLGGAAAPEAAGSRLPPASPRCALRDEHSGIRDVQTEITCMGLFLSVPPPPS